MLARRGVLPEEAASFLAPSLRDLLPDPARLEPLLAWGRAGGDLVFAGADDAVELLNTLPAVAGWLEDRFVLEELEGGRVWRFGLGLLAVQVPDPEGSPVGFPGPAVKVSPH